MKTKLLLTGLVFAALSIALSGQDAKSSPRSQTGKCPQSGFVDSNKNGICDNFENRQPGNRGQNGNGYHHGRNNCTGSAQKRSGQNGTGRNFIDENKNGICDHRESVQIK